MSTLLNTVTVAVTRCPPARLVSRIPYGALSSPAQAWKWIEVSSLATKEKVSVPVKSTSGV